MMDTNNPNAGKRLYIVTYGWPNVTVARDGIGAVKEDKCFGMKGLGENRLKFKIPLNVV